MLRSFSLLGIALAMAFSVAAQDEPKVKINDREDKYKSEDLKIKDKRSESKSKSEGLKIKEDGSTAKMKGRVRSMHITRTERTELRTGESEVKVQEHDRPLPTVPAAPEPAVTEPLPVVDVHIVAATPTVHHKRVVHRAVAVKSQPHKHPGVRYVVRTKVIRDTVTVASPPEQIVKVDTEYLHDTVSVTRVDTFIKMQKENTYTGYRVPRGDFKKVKLKKDKEDEVWMKRKDKDGRVEEKLK